LKTGGGKTLRRQTKAGDFQAPRTERTPEGMEEAIVEKEIEVVERAEGPEMLRAEKFSDKKKTKSLSKDPCRPELNTILRRTKLLRKKKKKEQKIRESRTMTRKGY